MNKINNVLDLEREIVRLKMEAKQKEIVLNNQFEELVENFEPGKLLNKGFRSMFSNSIQNKPIISTGLSLAAGFLIEKVLLRKTNFIVKYGLAQIAMNLVSTLVDENWNPPLIKKLKDALQKLVHLEKENTEESDHLPDDSRIDL